MFKYKKSFAQFGTNDMSSWRKKWKKTENLIAAMFIPVEHELRERNGCEEEEPRINCANVFNLFGVDVVWDSNGNPFLMEINADPGIDPAYEASQHPDKKNHLITMYRNVYSDALKALLSPEENIDKKQHVYADENNDEFTGFSNLFL